MRALLDGRNLSSRNAAVPWALSCSRLPQTLQEHSQTQANAKLAPGAITADGTTLKSIYIQPMPV